MDWKIRKDLPPLTVLLFRNSTNFTEVNAFQINQNALIAKISICENVKKRNKLLKKYQIYVKKIKTALYLLDKCLKMKIYKMLERQTNVNVPAFI